MLGLVGEQPAVQVARVPVDQHAAEVEDDGGRAIGSARRGGIGRSGMPRSVAGRIVPR